ncbi:MAG: hypothetical protein JOY78_20305 [Pseudonocardia sp.]|nr:hypothetical protein [Pseudonocardia sp.]
MLDPARVTLIALDVTPGALGALGVVAALALGVVCAFGVIDDVLLDADGIIAPVAVVTGGQLTAHFVIAIVLEAAVGVPVPVAAVGAAHIGVHRQRTGQRDAGGEHDARRRADQSTSCAAAPHDARTVSSITSSVR